MLTSQDLDQIKAVVVSAVDEKINPLHQQVAALDKKTDLLSLQVTDLDNKTDFLGKQVEAVDGKITGVEKRLDEKISGVEIRLTNRIENIEKGTETIKKDLKTIINFFDRENLDLVRRVEHLEKHLGLPNLT